MLIASAGERADNDLLGSCQAIVDALLVNSCLTSLNLRGNLDVPDLALNVAALLRRNTSLRELDLRAVHLAAPESRAILLDGLLTNTTLTTLSLGSNRLRYSAQAVADVLSENRTLTWLDLEGDDAPLGPDGGAVVAAALARNTSLTALGLKSNGLTADVGRLLADALRTNASLTSLSLRDNDLGARGGRALAALFKTNTTLIALNVRGNHVGEPVKQLLTHGLERNAELQAALPLRPVAPRLHLRHVLEIDWSDAAAPQPPTGQTHVRYALSVNGETVYEGPDTRFVLAGAAPNTRYAVQVTCGHAEGTGGSFVGPTLSSPLVEREFAGPRAGETSMRTYDAMAARVRDLEAALAAGESDGGPAASGSASANVADRDAQLHALAVELARVRLDLTAAEKRAAAAEERLAALAKLRIDGPPVQPSPASTAMSPGTGPAGEVLWMPRAKVRLTYGESEPSPGSPVR